MLRSAIRFLAPALLLAATVTSPHSAIAAGETFKARAQIKSNNKGASKPIQSWSPFAAEGAQIGNDDNEVSKPIKPIKPARPIKAKLVAAGKFFPTVSISTR